MNRLDPVRLAVGTLTAWPVRPPARVDRGVAGRAMLLAPAVGLGLGLVSAAVLAASVLVVPGSALLAAVLAVAALVAATRGLHLDGLADTADALGSGRPAPEALAIARRGDVGPFGVVTITLVLLVDVAALAAATSAGHGPLAVVVAVVTGRVALTWACRRGVPAARTEGLGALVAGTVPGVAAAAWTIIGVLAAGGVALAIAAPGWRLPIGSALAVLVGIIAGALVVRRAIRRLGGVTGDVLGAAVEIATAACLVVMAAASVAP